MKNNLMRLGMSLVLILSLMSTYITQPLPAKAEAASFKGASYIVPGKLIVKLKEEVQSPSSHNHIMGYTAKSLDPDNSQYKVLDLPTGSSVHTAVEELKSHPEVEYAEPVFINKMTAFPSNSAYSTAVQSAAAAQPDPEAASQWSLSVTEMTYAWEKVTVSSPPVIIAVLDTGVNGTHEDLQGQLVDGYDFINNKPILANQNSDDGFHGTFVAGIAAAKTNNGIGIAGVAGGAKIMPVKVLDQSGNGSSETMGQAIRWAADHGAKVINLSLGRPHYDVLSDGSLYDLYSQYENDAVQYAVSKKGAVVIAASGNDSNHWISPQPGNLDSINSERANPSLTSPYYSAVGYPASLPNAIAVGAIGQQPNGDLNIADFSNVGPQLDVVGPGVNMKSINGINSTSYSIKSGTSFSTPFVSGLAALLLTANHDLTPSEVEAILEDSSSINGLKRPNNNSLTDADYFGHGLVNGKKAFEIPRLKLSLTSGKLNTIDTLGLNLETTDNAGNVTQNVYSSANIIVAAYNPSKLDYVESSRTVKESTYFNSFQVALNDVGNYRIYAEVTDPHGNLHSGAVESYIAPGNVVANLNTGTYKGAITVTLSTATQSAHIYYTLDGSDPVGNVDALLYKAPLVISSTATLKAASEKNGAYSAASSYYYTINTASSGGSGGGGGGGGGGFFPPVTTPEPSAPGTAPVTVKADDAQLKSALEAAGTTQVIIDAKAGRNASSLRVEFGAAILKLASEKNKSVIIDTGRQVFNLPPGAVAVNDSTATVAFTITVSAGDTVFNKKPAQTKDITKAYDFSLSIGNESITRFAKPLSILWNLAAEGTNPAKLGVYYFNDNQQSWSYAGGKGNPDSSISFTTDHFSQFAVMEYNKTFDDMMQHWARNEVELLAAKYIVTGVTDNTFGPEQQLTRAEFAALLVRMLGAKTIGTTGIFNDVSPSSWYHDVVYQAYSAGLIEGMDASTFAPGEPITREQMAVMIMRAYSVGTGKKASDIAVTKEVKFTDEDLTGSWARGSIRLVSGLGFMDGFPDGSFKPADMSTRAQAAAVIKRLMDSIQK